MVLDEPSSALDAENERLLVDTFSSLKRLRTLIIVSHRLSTILPCDRICVLRDGQVIEQGTHHELLRRGGLYYRMASEQHCAQPEAGAFAA